MIRVAAVAAWAATLRMLVPWSTWATVPLVVAYAAHVYRIWKNERTITTRGPRLFPDLMRRRALDRQGRMCRYCGPIIGTNVHHGFECPAGGGCPNCYEADHIIAWDDGGSTVESNLAVSCLWCNRTKGARDPDEFISWLWSPDGQRALANRARVRERG